MSSPGLRRARELSLPSGLITLSRLVDSGASPDMAERQVHAARWQRPARGVYVTSADPLSGLALGHAAEAYVAGRVVVSGSVVLRELGLRWVPPGRRVLALVEPTVRRRSSGLVTVRRTTGLAELSVWTRDGLQLAPVERAIVDAAREQDRLRDVRGIVLGAVADGWASADELQHQLDSTQRNGSGLVRRAIGDAHRGCASPPEAELVDELVGCGIPFYVNAELVLHGALLGITDVWFPGLGLGGEAESAERHGSEQDVETTYDRHERITDFGLELVHLSVRRIRADPREAARHLLTRASTRRRLAVREPAGLMVRPRGPLLG